MEFQIHNKYIKRFFSKFPGQNELKLLKYLTVLGINHIEQTYQQDISFESLKNMAKTISSKIKKKDIELKNEILNIKQELLKLNEKFEEKLSLKQNQDSQKKAIKIMNSQNERKIKQSSSPDEMKHNKTPKTHIQENRSTSVRTHISSKPPTQWREGEKSLFERKRFHADDNHAQLRANSIEVKVYPEWWDWDVQPKTSKNEQYITPKITEIEPPKIDSNSNRNFISRHHLDDRETKKLLTEDESNLKSQELQNTKPVQSKSKETKSTKKESPESCEPKNMKNRKSVGIKDKEREKEMEKFEKEREKEREDAKSFTIGKRTIDAGDTKISSPLAEIKNYERTEYKSPKFMQQPNDSKTHNTQGHQIASQRQKESKGDTGKFGNTANSKTNAKSENIVDTSQKNTGRAKKPKMSHSKANLEKPSTVKFSHIESKIKDEVNYHKKLTKEYKKIRNSYKINDDISDDAPSNSSSRDYGGKKFIIVTKQEPYGISPGKMEENSRMGTDERFFQSSQSGQRSFNMNPYSRTPIHESSMNRSKKLENMGKYDDVSHYKSSLNQYERERELNNYNNNVYNIASSFVNSPLMHHLSNQESKASDFSSKEATNNLNGYRPQMTNTNVNVNDFDLKSPSNPNRSFIKKYYDDEPRVNKTSYKQSDWAYDNRYDYKDNTSMLKDSQNRRFADVPPKDSRIYEKNENQSSFDSSSDFSNFLDDNMKGFFQKQYDGPKFRKSASMLKRSKYSAVSSDNSSNISFKGADQSTTNNPFDGKKDKNPYHNNYLSNKSYMGGGGGNGNDTNFYKQQHDRMSVSRLLTNSQN